MSELNDILNLVPIDQLAQQLGADPAEVEQATEAALPALLGGLHANANDPAGAASIANALQDHQEIPQDLDQIDEQDGEKIVGHIFGDNQPQVMQQLGGLGGGSMGPLIQKLLPILAPIVMSFIAKQMQQRTGQSTTQAQGQTEGGGIFPGGQGQPADASTGATQDQGATTQADPVQDILGSILGGITGGGSGSGAGGGIGGKILNDVLGGLLGGGRR